MDPHGAPEELRFDFAEELGEEPRRARRQVGAEDAASALQRRVDEVIAVAHSRRPRRGRPSQALLVSEVVELEDIDGGHGARGDLITGLGREERALCERDELEMAERPAEGAEGEEAGGETVHDGRSSDAALSIAAFYEKVRHALEGVFPGEVWVTGEIRRLRESRGHRYLELGDEGEGTRRSGVQQLEVVCWARDWPPVAAALAQAGVDLEEGRVVRVRGRVSVWEGGSKLRFTLSAIDIDAFLGGIAAARHRLLAALAAEDLLEANKRLGCPLVPLRIGVVTSPGSEAHRDFLGQLERSGYNFEVLLEPSLVQGPEAPFQIAGALGRLARRSPDLAVVVRGGGARGDLAAFDSEEVARAIATAPFPVWTGVGHTGDHSVADEVAQRSFITPTACGQAVVQLVASYVEGVAVLARNLSSLARARLDGAVTRLESRRQALSQGVVHQLDRRRDALSVVLDRLDRAVEGCLGQHAGRLAGSCERLSIAPQRMLAREDRELHRHRQVLRAYDPRRQLERGWSLTRDASGRLLRSCEQVAPGSRLRTRLSDGEVGSVVSELAWEGDGT
jgi:exodeoxyribonuclease VII large subunit